MKKTLIALAAVAATGAAFAQSSVTLSGELAYGYQAGKTANVGYKGFGMDTAAVTFAVTEDLGGGLKVSGDMTLGGIARNGGTAGEDMKIIVSGGFGSVMMGAIKIGSGIRGLAQAGAPVNNMEGEVLPAAVTSDIVKYTAPAMGGFKFSGSLTENTNAPALGDGLGQSQARAVTVGVDYAAGPVAAKFDYSDWSKSANKNRFRIAGSYDLGVAKLGAGYERTKLVAGGSSKSTMLGVSAPVGAFTVGAAWVKTDTTATAGDKTGYTLGAKYALSKRTSVNANYARWDNAEGGTVKDNKTTILLSHTF